MKEIQVNIFIVFIVKMLKLSLIICPCNNMPGLLTRQNMPLITRFA